MRVLEPLKEQVQFLIDNFIDNYRDSLTVDKNQNNQIILWLFMDFRDLSKKALKQRWQ